ncbi:MAG: alpha/beta fold hydrolase [Aquabacterium sp.]
MKVRANGLDIEVEDEGPRDGPVVLLIMGLSMQLTAWPPELVADLVGRGFRVIRPDNRDIGLSTHLHHLGLPNVGLAVLRHMLHLPVRAPYGIGDMAADCAGVLDALGVSAAHVCGASMGGMVAQHLAARHPQRVRSLTLLMTSSGARRLPQPALRIRRALVARPSGTAFDDWVAHGIRLFSLIGSPAYPPDPQRLRERVAASMRRSVNPAGSARQLVAIAADGDRSAMLSQIQAPTLVIHGKADPLIPLAAGEDLMRLMKGARADFIDGMGHDLPLELLPRFAAGIADNAARSTAA